VTGTPRPAAPDGRTDPGVDDAPDGVDEPDEPDEPGGRGGVGGPGGPAPRALTVTGLLLLDPLGHDPTTIESITFDDTGIGVVRRRGQEARLLPWDAVVAHAVEPWAGGVIPEWWVDPEAQLPGRSGAAPVANPMDALFTEPVTTGRPLPHAEAGALISIQTRTGTYRFLRSGGDPSDLAARITEFAVRQRGPAGASTVTTVAPGRQGSRHPDHRSGWERVRPWLVAFLVVLLAAVVTVILLQSAGVVHLPLLGGGSSGAADALLSRR